MSIAEDQAADFRAPEVDKILVIAVDATSRQYDLSALDLGTVGAEVATPPGTAGERWVYLTIHAETADVYYAFDNVAGRTISATATTAAGSPPAFSNDRAWRCPKDGERNDRIDRQYHRYLYLKTSSGTATVRIRASSGGPPGASAV